MVKLVKKTPPPGPGKDTDGSPAPAAKKTSSRRWWRYPLLFVFAAIFLSSGWFTYRVAAATNKIFAENTTGGSPILKGKKVKGEGERVNILLLGIGGPGHDGPNLSDTIQVASVNPKTKQIAMLSIPRDLYVQVPDSLTKVKINEVHAIGEDQGLEGGGPALDKKLVGSMLDIPIHYFIRVDFEGFRQMVDAVGGVDITVSQRLYDPYYPKGTGYQIVRYEPGVHHMNGEQALQYARSRETSSDFDRSRRQQEVMAAVRDKSLSLQYLTNPAKIAQFIQIAGDRVKTDLTLGELERLAEIVKDIPTSSVQSKVIDNGDTGLLYDSIGPGGAYILLPSAGDYSEIRQFASEFFTGQSVAAEAARLEIQNATGRPGLAAQISESLKSGGYNIVNMTTSPTLAQATVIYDFSGGKKPNTVNLLTKRFQGARVVTQQGDGSIDIRIVVGSDYTGSTQSQYGGGAR